MANLLHNGIKTDLVWEVLKTTKTELVYDLDPDNMVSWDSQTYRSVCSKYGLMNMYQYFFDTLLCKLKISSVILFDLIEEKVSDDTLETAAQMFIYMTAPQHKYWVKIFYQYSHWLENLSLRRTLGNNLLSDKVM